MFTSSLEAQNAPQALISSLQEHVRKDNFGRSFPKFGYVLTDLNGDGKPDAIVILRSQSWCGMAGCPLLIFKGEEDGFTFISESGITFAPIRISPEKVRGWKTLIVRVKHKGNVLLQFNGNGYPSNSYNGIKATQSQINNSEIVINSSQIILDR